MMINLVLIAQKNRPDALNAMQKKHSCLHSKIRSKVKKNFQKLPFLTNCVKLGKKCSNFFKIRVQNGTRKLVVEVLFSHLVFFFYKKGTLYCTLYIQCPVFMHFAMYRQGVMYIKCPVCRVHAVFSVHAVCSVYAVGIVDVVCSVHTIVKCTYMQYPVHL